MYRENKALSERLPFLAFLPLAIFLLYPKFKYLLYSCTPEWQEPFYIGALLAIVVTTLLWLAHIPLDRLLLGTNLFLILAASFFAFNSMPCLTILGTYKGVIFFSCILAVGIISTLTTTSGFFAHRQGLISQQRILSWILCGATALMGAWAYFMSSYSIAITIVIPFIMLRILAEYLQSELRVTP